MDENVEKIISGGPMMGQAMFSLEVPVIKGSSALLAFKQDEISRATMTNCLNYGKCCHGLSGRYYFCKLAHAADANEYGSICKNAWHGMYRMWNM